jgi:thymidylate synthase ThyX
VRDAGLSTRYDDAMERSHELYDVLREQFPTQASYAVALGYRIRYVMQMNAREAMHLCELRSSPQGHPAYRRIAQAMHRQIGERAGHRAIAATMSYVDHGAYDLERLDAERAAEARRALRS